MRPLEAARQGQTEKITGEKEATIILHALIMGNSETISKMICYNSSYVFSS